MGKEDSDATPRGRHVLPGVHSSGHEHVGRRLKDLREAAGLSLRELEEHTGVGRSRLSQLESEQFPNPSLGVLLALQSAFQLGTLEALLGSLPSEALARQYRRDRQQPRRPGAEST